MRRISDGLCIENGLSIVEKPKRGKDYGAWLGDDKPVSWQEKLRCAIDIALDEKPVDMTAFIQLMKASGYEVREGKHLSFRAPEQKKFTRLRSLGGDYTDESVRERIEGKRIVAQKRKTSAEISIIRETPKFSLIIDLQNCIKAKNSPGYEQWAKVFNIKQAAQTIIYLQDNKLTDYKKLETKCTEAKKLFNDLSVQIKAKESRLNEISTLQKHIGNYIRTRETYAQYRQAGYNKKFLAAHESDILLHQNTKKVFDELGLKKLPTLKTLQTEYATLLAEKKKLYQSYRATKEDMQEVLLAKNNSDRLLNYSASEKSQGIDSRQR